MLREIDAEAARIVPRIEADGAKLEAEAMCGAGLDDASLFEPDPPSAGEANSASRTHSVWSLPGRPRRTQPHMG